MNEIPESELWECSTCKQPHPIETDYECASCGMLASEHISVTAMCRIIREWQSRAYSAELKLARIERELNDVRAERDEAMAEVEKLKEELESHAWTISPAMAQAKIEELREQRDRLLEEREQWRMSSVCRELREQRDRLAEVIKAATVLIAAKGRHNTMLAYEGLKEALAAVEGGSDMHPCAKCDAPSEPYWPCRICGTPLSTEKPPALRELFCEGCKALPATKMTQCTMNRGGIKEQGEPET